MYVFNVSALIHTSLVPCKLQFEIQLIWIGHNPQEVDLKFKKEWEEEQFTELQFREIQHRFFLTLWSTKANLLNMM